MTSSQNSIWSHDFNLPQRTKCILQKTTSFLSKEKLIANSEIPIVDHVYKFHRKCLSYYIYYKGALCKLFSLTLIG